MRQRPSKDTMHSLSSFVSRAKRSATFSSLQSVHSRICSTPWSSSTPRCSPSWMPSARQLSRLEVLKTSHHIVRRGEVSSTYPLTTKVKLGNELYADELKHQMQQPFRSICYHLETREYQMSESSTFSRSRHRFQNPHQSLLHGDP